MDGIDPDTIALQQHKSIKDYYICENNDVQGCSQTELVLEADGRSNEMEWAFENLQPVGKFCNWAIKIKGINPATSALDEKDLANYVVNLRIEAGLNTEYTLVSATDKLFDFGEIVGEDSKSYATLTLERAA